MRLCLALIFLLSPVSAFAKADGARAAFTVSATLITVHEVSRTSVTGTTSPDCQVAVIPVDGQSQTVLICER